MATKVMRTLSIHRQVGKEGVVWNRDPGEEASQSYKAGAPLVLDATSKEVEIWAGGTDAVLPIGIAAKDATGTTAAAVPYYQAVDYNEFEGSLINATTAYTLLGTELGVSYSLIASGNDWYIDVADTTTTLVCITGLIDATGDINPRVRFRFLQAAQGDVR